MTIHWIDYVIIATIFLSVITGLFRGFVKEIVALFTWMSGLYCAFLYSERCESLFITHIHDKTLRLAAAFVAVLITVLIIGALVTRLLNIILYKTGLSGTDRVLGMGFGFIRGLFTVSLIIIAVKMANIPSINALSQDSLLYARFEPLVKNINKHIPQVIAQAEKVTKLDELSLRKNDPAENLLNNQNLTQQE